MKRFMLTALLLLLAVLSVYYSIFYLGMDWSMSEVQPQTAPFRAADRRLEVWDGAGYVPLLLRGVDVSSSVPGAAASTYAPGEADYLRWLEAIGDMGANAVRTVTVMDDDFYNALYTYNTTHDSPLYLLQGTSLSANTGDGSGDAYDDRFLGNLLADGRALVDVIHGRRNLTPSLPHGGGVYRRDVSPWVAGFLVGTEWVPDTIAYTDHSSLYDGTYSGAYFQTTAEATPFEAMLAQVMDAVTAYEAEKYGVQRPIGVVCSPDCDFLLYAEEQARRLQKYARLDPEHIRPTAGAEAGRFAAYRLYEFCDEFLQYLAPEQSAALGDLLEQVDPGQMYGGYLGLLTRYHTMPVIAAGYGVSSARGVMRLGEEPLTEREQGERLAQISRTLEAEGWAGGFISAWQDVWERSSWNTAFASVHSQTELWHDLTTDSQNYGLMAFDPGEEPVCTVDGDPEEWEEEDVLLEAGGLRLSARYDAEGLYLLAEGVSSGQAVYLPFDVTPELGSLRCDSPALTFQREADFLLCLDGPNSSRLLVQERYDAMREQFLLELEGRNAFVNFPDGDSGRFVPIRMAADGGPPPLSSGEEDDPDPYTVRSLRLMGTWEAGRLRHGNGGAGPDRCSLADFCYGADCVEVRIPWLLLNVGDPPSMAVHRDYYQHYGVEMKPVRELWMGLGKGGEEISMAAFPVKGWRGSVAYRERLKDSYYVIQALWKEETDHASDS